MATPSRLLMGVSSGKAEGAAGGEEGATVPSTSSGSASFRSCGSGWVVPGDEGAVPV